MTRFLRIVVPGWMHHVTQRGNHRQTVFFSDQDRHTYLSLLQKHFSRHELGLIGFCLVDLNRVRAGLVDHAWDWDWCSSPAHVTEVDRTGLLDMHLWQEHFDDTTWRQFLERAPTQKTIQQRVRNATATGRLLGNVEVAKQLEQLLGRSILPRKKGRRPAGTSNVRKLGN
jgi:hypothetical protein